MPTLTAEKVLEIGNECLFREGEDTTVRRMAEGITITFAFNPVRLALHAGDIKKLLDCLPDNFHAGKGGGWTFLNACLDKEGNQWGEHRDVELLMCLGLALGIVRYVMPREHWKLFPGGMPYFVILSHEQQDPKRP